jgi:hypothetical protein
MHEIAVAAQEISEELLKIIVSAKLTLLELASFGFLIYVLWELAKKHCGDDKK